MDNKDMMLYWASGSPFCWMTMLALEEKGCHGYGNKLIAMDKKEHKSAEILNLNRRGQVWNGVLVFVKYS